MVFAFCLPPFDIFILPYYYTFVKCIFNYMI
nr:MAG TPA: hypothetical protein [Caudoviricetes sp.]